MALVAFGDLFGWLLWAWLVCFVAWMVVLISGLLCLLVVLIVLLCVVFFDVKCLLLCVCFMMVVVAICGTVYLCWMVGCLVSACGWFVMYGSVFGFDVLVF